MGGSDDIRQHLADSLSRFGVAGDVAVEPGRATLFGSGPTVSVDIGRLVEEWAGYSDEIRKRRINEIARRLAAERRNVLGGSSAPRTGTSIEWQRLLVPIVLLVTGFGALIGYRRWVKLHPPEGTEKPLIADYDAYERDRAQRAERVCETTRSRVMRGATVGPSDVEGWVVELWALRKPDRPPPHTDPAIAAFVLPATGQDKGRVVFREAPTLAAANGPDTEADVVADDVTGQPGLTYRGVRITMTGRYVVPYFDDTGRNEYLRFARVLTDSIGAEYAALYARCAAGHSHHLGSWFRGPTAGGAVTALLFFMGVFEDHPDLRASVLFPNGEGSTVDAAFAFQSISAAAAAVKKASAMTLLAKEGGMISGTDSTVATISFPFRDGNRASRASFEIARDLGIGDLR